ncbi:unnamed protein product, partial [Allacma fusca]
DGDTGKVVEEPGCVIVEAGDADGTTADGTTVDGTKRVEKSGTTTAVVDIVAEDGRELASSDSTGSNTEEGGCVIFHCISYLGASAIK